MLRQQDLEQLQSNLASQKTLWAMMLLAPFIYLAIGYFLGPVWQDRSWGGEWLLPAMRLSLVVLALANVLVCRHVRARVLRGHPGRIVKRICAKLEKSAGDTLHPAACLYQAVLVFCLGLAESIALFGVALFVFGDSLVYLFLFANFSAIVIIYFRPRMVDLISIAAHLDAGKAKPDDEHAE
jgi:hypothetical protein